MVKYKLEIELVCSYPTTVQLSGRDEERQFTKRRPVIEVISSDLRSF